MISDKIINAYPVFSKSGKKAANFFLKKASEIEILSLKKIAAGADVSEPTIMRMLKKAGFESLT